MAKRILIAMLALLMMLSCFACNTGKAPDDETTPVQTTTSVPVSVKLTGDVNYTIIRPEESTDEINACASDLWMTLKDMAGQMLVQIDSDWVQKAEQADNDKHEILIGHTNRPESAAALAELPTYLDYLVKVEGNKIVVSANTAERLAAATEYLKANIKADADGVLIYTGVQYYVNSYDAYKYKKLTLCGVDISEYSIIIPAAASAADISFSDNLKTKIAEETGVILEIKTDAEAAGANEILVGKTNRAASSEFTSGALVLKGKSYSLKTAAGVVVCSAGSISGYNAMIEKIDELIVGEALAADINESVISSAAELEDGTNIMVIGNSQLYYGECVEQSLSRKIQNGSEKLGLVDNGYLSVLCNSIASDVTVYNCTIGGAGLKSLYSKMTQHHPNYYGNSAGKAMDSFYDQDFVILQQEGSDNATTLEYAEKLIKLFPPETKFMFFMHEYHVRNNHTNVFNAAKTLRDKYDVTYIPTGHVTYDIYKGVTKVPGSSIAYNKNTFIVNWLNNGKVDSNHPNYLTGYLSTIMIYSAMTGESCVGLDWSFVSRDDKKYYTNAPSNYVSVLESEADMHALQQIADEYLKKYNP